MDFSLDDEIAFYQAEESLRVYLAERHHWFTGGAVTVNVGRRVLNPEELRRLRQVFEKEFHFKVTRFWCDVETLEEAISEEAQVPVALGLPRRDLSPAGERPRSGEMPLFVKNTCRSGTIVHHNGDVIVLGDVNPGAQVTAAGDIIVLGTLRGIAHAGVNSAGQTEAVIIALALRPLQLRIGRHVSVAPPDKENHVASTQPEIAYVSGHSIVVAPFTGRFQGMQERNCS